MAVDSDYNEGTEIVSNDLGSAASRFADAPNDHTILFLAEFGIG